MLVQYIACIIKLRLACPEFSNLQQLMLDLTLQRKRLVQIGKAKLLKFNNNFGKSRLLHILMAAGEL